MEFEQFKQEVKDRILDFLPEKYENARVSIEKIAKNNEVLDGLVIRDEKVNVAPTIYLNSFFDDVNKAEVSMEDTLSKIARVYEGHSFSQSFDPELITNFDNVKDKIIPRLVGIDNNAELLATRPHEVVADNLAVTYQIPLGKNEDSFMSTPINFGLLKEYGIDKEELHSIAMENLSKNMTFKLQGMNEILADIVRERVIEEGGTLEDANRALDVMLPENNPMYVLTNEEKTNGSVGILDQNTMDKVGDEIGMDFFILPSSIHEVIIIPMDENAPIREQLEEMVREVNSAEVQPQDRLSDSVYAYDRESKELMRAEKYEERLNDKTKGIDAIGKTDEKKRFSDTLNAARVESNARKVKSELKPPKINKDIDR